jgi:hypothetical protein
MGFSFEYPCPCCGYKVFQKPLGSYEICPICFWEDDMSQLRYPLSVGANSINLLQSQDNYQKFGAMAVTMRKNVRSPTSSDRREPNWRKLDLRLDIISSDEAPEFWKQHDNPDLYYWRWNK